MNVNKNNHMNLVVKKYQYIHVGGVFFCQQQSLLRLAGLLIISRSRYPEFICWKLLFKLFLNKIKIRQYPIVLELSFFGSWCLRGRMGYIVINPYLKTATKVYNEEIDKKVIRKEIQKSLYVSRYNFAPRIITWNTKERWYQEDCLFGKTGYYFSPKETDEFLRIYFEEVAPCLVNLIGSFDCNRITINDRLQAIYPLMEIALDDMGKKNTEIAMQVNKFYQDISEELSSHGDKEIYQVFAHGDFHLFNMFNTDSGLMLIDWDGSGTQSLMYDFYNYFFSHLWTGRSRSNLVHEVTDAVSDMTKRLESKYPKLAFNVSKRWRLYCKLYYLERICALCTIFKLQPEQLFVWMNIYRTFEANIQSVARIQRTGFNESGSDWIGAVPVPAAVWLFGSGLLGLVGIAGSKKVA